MNTSKIEPSSILKTLFFLGLVTIAFKPQPAISAEKVKLIYGPFKGNISVESLEKYAKTGEMSGEFRLYSKFVKPKTLAQLRYWLNNRFQSDRIEVHDFTNSPEGEKFLTELGTAIKTHPQHNGFYAIRSALIKAADKPNDSDGWTIIEAMTHFPSEDLQINTRDLFKLQKFWSASDDNSTALEAFNTKKN